MVITFFEHFIVSLNHRADNNPINYNFEHYSFFFHPNYYLEQQKKPRNHFSISTTHNSAKKKKYRVIQKQRVEKEAYSTDINNPHEIVKFQ